MESGEWPESGEWRVESGELRVENNVLSCVLSPVLGLTCVVESF